MIRLKTRKLVYRLSDGTYWCLRANIDDQTKVNRVRSIREADDYSLVPEKHRKDDLAPTVSRRAYGLEGEFVWFDVITVYKEARTPGEVRTFEIDDEYIQGILDKSEHDIEIAILEQLLGLRESDRMLKQLRDMDVSKMSVKELHQYGYPPNIVDCIKDLRKFVDYCHECPGQEGVILDRAKKIKGIV